MKKKNYILIFIIYIFTVFISFYVSLIYKKNMNVVQVSLSNEILIDVTDNNYENIYNNILNYTVENHNFIVYIGSHKNTFLSQYDKILYDISVNNNLRNILYINVDKFDNYDFLYSLFDRFSFSYDIYNFNIPFIVHFNDGNIIDVFSIYGMDLNSILVKFSETGVIE